MLAQAWCAVDIRAARAEMRKVLARHVAGAFGQPAAERSAGTLAMGLGHVELGPVAGAGDDDATVQPAQLNPFGHNPLWYFLHDLIDCRLLNDPAAPKLFVPATDVKPGGP